MRGLIRSLFRCSAILLAFGLSACSKSGGLLSPELANELLNSPDPFVATGSAFPPDNVTYIYADSSGRISASTNQISVTVPDPALPLTQLDPNAVFSDIMDSGNCVLLPLTSTATDSTGATIYTSIAATSCIDQSSIELDFDTSELSDNAGNEGSTGVGITFIVDNAPITTSEATGNTSAGGSGSTESSPGVYKTASDNSVVITFAKDMSGGNLTPSLSGATCTATIASASLIGGSTVVWTLGGTLTPGMTCDLDISAMTDGAGNPVDPSDPNLTSMTLAFQ
jgi:hypothetical protein